MLTELRISNFAVIEQLNLEFTSGFQVLTGETGAGKSILVDAIALLVGGRASTEQIRAGQEEAVLEAVFVLPSDAALTAALREASLLPSGGTELIVRRVIARSGRNRIFLNGALAPLHQLQTLAGTLVDIHGQHEQQSLLAPQAQLDALDAFAHLRPLRQAYATQYRTWRQRQREYEELKQLADEQGRREELLRFEVRELDEVGLQPGEEQVLEAERQRLLHARRLAELTQDAYALLYEAEPSVLGLLGMVSARLREVQALDPSTHDWTSRGEATIAELRDLTEGLRDYRDALEQDPGRLEAVEARWDRLQRLKKKHGLDLAGLLELAERRRRELSTVGDVAQRVDELREAMARDRAGSVELAAQLSEHRAKAARKLEARVVGELEALRMQGTRFSVHLARLTQDEADEGLGPTGCDRVEYLLSANVGEALQPLARVASGGELSRVMLALKSTLAETDQVPVLVFDEVDSGIGGVAAGVVARRLRDLGRFHQVFCITHLPQVAAQAQAHFLVEKRVVKQRTVTQVRRLEGRGRQDEIARMLAGDAVTSAVRATAAELLGHAAKDAETDVASSHVRKSAPS